MRDPIYTFEKIRDFYISYLETAFRIGPTSIQEIRRTLLESINTLATEPLVEPLPNYAHDGTRIDDLLIDEIGEKWLPNFTKSDREAFVDLCLGGLIPNDKLITSQAKFPLYLHQLEMLKKGVQAGTPGIVTSGTGSGKTESFLLPILAAISKEATSWAPSPNLRKYLPWWHNEDSSPTFMRQSPFEAAGRPKAVRALILYPMNALVEDQLVRLRKALDSESSINAMDKHFHGNRIFFGRYTGATKVSGWLKHPRINESDERKKEKRRIDELREYLKKVELTHKEACLEGNNKGDENLPFNFPKASGGELISRWEMQSFPPDILITNTSMLSIMLVREIDEGIFDQTRDWIENDPNSYFYLVLDELHLQRGSAGTEVAYLLRSLIERLGLDKDKNRHKLRILCSSASLPVENDLREQSLEYLWGFFGKAGLAKTSKKSDWSTAIVAGSQVPTQPTKFNGDIDNLLSSIQKLEDQINKDVSSKISSNIWLEIANELGIQQVGNIEKTAEKVIAYSGQLIESGCSKNGIGVATTVTQISERIFGTNLKAIETTKKLLWLRSLSDSWKDIFNSNFPDSIRAPRFRIHTFIRAIEGLFVAPQYSPVSDDVQSRTKKLFGDITVEPGVRYGETHSDGLNSRRVDLLYCECCGTLFYGGRRSTSETGQIELLPNDPDTDSLPERAKINQVEQHSAKDYALFMPTLTRFHPIGNERPDNENSDSQGDWHEAEFDPALATIFRAKPIAEETQRIPGWVYVVDKDPRKFKGSAKRKQTCWTDSGSALPFQCPACSESYKTRLNKLSPIRGFRVGFAKTTQLLASSLMSELQKTQETERLVSFSDSRQDAAKAAFDLESGHHDDVRREIIVRTFESLAKEIGNPEIIKIEIEQIRNKIKELFRQENPDEEEASFLLNEKQILEKKLVTAAQDCVAIREIAEPSKPQMGEALKPILSKLVETGIHPIDKSGINTVPEHSEEGVSFAWQQLFEKKHGQWCWITHPNRVDDFLVAFQTISRELLALTGNTIFEKTYFALEESGWGYPCLPLRAGKTREDLAKYDAMLRVLADGYRTIPSNYDESNPWTSAADAIKNRRLKKYLNAIALVTSENILLLAENLLNEMQLCGHINGLIYISELQFKPVKPDHSYWRCSNCGRVHLHFGGSVCTRCGSELPIKPTGIANDLRENSFLGKRILNSSRVHRMRAEELTGMTNNPAARLRRFKGILINDEDDILPMGYGGISADKTLDYKARVVDVLSVTTTMEVGVDIGDLRSVFQANMPPQRFNYQQRVGRAGRRGQAYSFVLTVCRSKSHDLHYFRNPSEITGDPPPPPFLTTTLDQIANRLITKVWCVAAFRYLRLNAGKNWTGDDLREKPDNHGEFMPVSTLVSNRQQWFAEIRTALEETTHQRDSFALLCFGGDETRTNSLFEKLSADTIIGYISTTINDSLMHSKGLAEALAEHGYFPMYGMPTRSRLLHTRPQVKNKKLEIPSMDRDLDVAIQEFSPGKFLIQDKRRYYTSGYAGESLILNNYGQTKSFNSNPPELGSVRYLVECSVCLSWSRAQNKDAPNGSCDSCGNDLSGSKVHSTYAPHGFITSLIDKKIGDGTEEIQAKPSRSSIAEAETIQTIILNGTNLRIGTSTTSQLYRLNRGEFKDNLWSGWNAKQGTLRAKYDDNGTTHSTYVKNIWIDEEALRLDAGSEPLASRFEPNGRSEKTFYLSAPKVTDSLLLEFDSIPNELALLRQSDSGEKRLSQGFRSGALSAMFMLIDYASRKILDVDPSEFEILEPRLRMRNEGSFLLPVMQIADELVNGSGLTNRLSQEFNSSKETIVLHVMRELMNTNNPFLQNLLNHSDKCLTGCYKCLHRYGNQSYHGLLDWRLGLDVIQLFLNNNYLAGIDGNFTSPGILDWKVIAEKLAIEASKLYSTQVITKGGIPVLEIDSSQNKWAAVVHPFWNTDILRDYNPELDEWELEIGSLSFISTFDLARKIGVTISKLRAS